VGYPIIKSALKSPAIVNYLIEQGADLQTKITWRGARSGIWIIGDDATTLHYAVSDGVPETVKILLDAGVDPFAIAHDPIDKEDKQTALEVAAFEGRTDCVIALLEHPAFKNADQTIRQQVLNKSLTTGSFSSSFAYQAQDRSELLEALMTHGAKFDSTESKDSPIQIAVTQIHPNHEERNDSIEKMVSVLRKHGHELDVFSAVAIGDFDTLGKLLETDPQAANSYSIEGYPALHMAVKMNYSEAVKIMLDAGCDIEIRSKSEKTGWNGETALLSVAFWGHDEIAKMLLRAGANANATAQKKNVSPLHQAVRMGNLGVARLLLENGANKQAKDQDGKTPLEWISDGASAEKFKELFLAFENTPEKK
jgi:ankyrin repeat protein